MGFSPQLPSDDIEVIATFNLSQRSLVATLHCLPSSLEVELYWDDL
jgi:hypothetical protein